MLANWSTGLLRYIQLSKARNWTSISCGQFRIGGFRIWLQSLTDNVSMLFTVYTNLCKGPLLVTRLLGDCSNKVHKIFRSISERRRFTIFSLDQFWYRVFFRKCVISNNFQTNWQQLLMIVNLATSCLSLLCSQHWMIPIPFVPTWKCHELVTGPLWGFRM